MKTYGLPRFFWHDLNSSELKEISQIIIVLKFLRFFLNINNHRQVRTDIWIYDCLEECKNGLNMLGLEKENNNGEDFIGLWLV